MRAWMWLIVAALVAGCAGAESEAGDAASSPSVEECAPLGQAECGHGNSCFAVLGIDSKGASSKDEFAGCAPPDIVCIGTTACGVHPESGHCFVFGSGCVPPSWKGRDCGVPACAAGQ